MARRWTRPHWRRCEAAGSQYDWWSVTIILCSSTERKRLSAQTAGTVTGYTGEQKCSGVSVNSRHGLERIGWDASALNAAGGKIVQNGRDCMRCCRRTGHRRRGERTPSAVWRWTRRATALRRSDTQVTVQATVNKQTSTFTPVTVSCWRTGRATQVLT
ncbi:hypothetical protein KCP71_06685 [Salmonella enterica subsp. enterica]|nr:hypothetical protein KCP71_06685 [Salmonella enterica subsp. enterica]